MNIAPVDRYLEFARSAYRLLVENDMEGFSIDVHGNRASRGYMVGGFAPSSVFAGPLDVYGIQRYIERADVQEQLAVSSAYLGAWKDEDGRTHLDVSRVFHSFDHAWTVSQLNGQVSFWDLNKKEAVYPS